LIKIEIEYVVLQAEQCFCGDRVGFLLQGKGIPEVDKDSDKHLINTDIHMVVFNEIK